MLISGFKGDDDSVSEVKNIYLSLCKVWYRLASI